QQHTAKLCGDVVFQPCYRPKGRFGDVKCYFSGKHHRYGVKVESVHYPNGIAALPTSPHYPGSFHDFSIFLENYPRYEVLLRKTPQDNITDSYLELKGEYPNHWGSVWDRAYQGAQEKIRAFVIKKGRNLSSEERQRNRNLAETRVKTENFYGRLKKLWGVCSGTYRGDHEYYDDTIAICFALTNYHISLRPLDAADATFYKHTLAAYIQEGKERKQKEDEWRRRYRIRRTQREEVDSELLSIESSQELI
ncbi:MAG: transposase family protein, partial [Cytophagales bacterium]|nr:transposase family protein [Cytophagales bacterium]